MDRNIKLIGISLGDSDGKYTLPRDYASAIIGAGGTPIAILGDAKAVRAIDALVLPGGGDVCPRYGGYGGNATDDYLLSGVNEARDELELELCHIAISRGIRVLGICRGLQLYNVALGGTLFHDIEDACGIHEAHRGGVSHIITTKGGSLIRGLMGDSPTVNSYHHQCVNRLGSSLCATARSPEGVVEAIENRFKTALLTQFHPERMADTQKLFKWVVE